MKRKTKIFVTGAPGFVASHLIPMLVKNDYKITAMVRHLSEKSEISIRVKVVVGDLSQDGTWSKALRGKDVVIHLASQIAASSPILFARNNTLAARNLVDAAMHHKVKKFILFSSAAVTSTRLDMYAKTKKDQEEIVSKSSLNGTIFRPSMIYGPGDTKNIGWLISFIRKMPIIPLPAGDDIGRQPVYVEDICKIVLKVIEKDYPKKIYEIHGKEYITLKKMITTIIKILKLKRFVMTIPIWSLAMMISIQEKILPSPKFTRDQIESLTSGEKFKGDAWWETFGIIPTRFEVGVAKMIEK